MDPVTIVVTALSLGAAAGLKPTAEQAVKDSYAGLKRLIQDGYARAWPAAELVAEDPDDEDYKKEAEKALKKEAADTDQELLVQAETLLQAVKEHQPEAAKAVGLDLEDIEAMTFRAKDIIAQGNATAVRAKGLKIEGDIDIEGIRADSDPK